MTKPIARDLMYRCRSFDADIIELCVRWYITYRLSYRDLVAMMAERGVEVSHTAILRWIVRYVPEFEKRWSRYARRIGSSSPRAISVRLHHGYQGNRSRSVGDIVAKKVAQVP
jgi:transposase-like protein